MIGAPFNPGADSVSDTGPSECLPVIPPPDQERCRPVGIGIVDKTKQTAPESWRPLIRPLN